MNLETVPQKHLNELERQVRELMATMKKAKLQNEPLVETLKLFEQVLEETRRKRFDAVNSQYKSY